MHLDEDILNSMLLTGLQYDVNMLVDVLKVSFQSPVRFILYFLAFPEVLVALSSMLNVRPTHIDQWFSSDSSILEV